MKRIALLFILMTAFSFSCKKFIEQTYKNALLNIMTDGQWRMNSYTENGTDITTQWDGYTFQFYSNLNVDAMKNGVVISTGTWNASTTDTTFSANFPLSANDTLRKLNGSWRWNDSSPTYVKATNKTRNDKLYLVKQ